MKNWTKILPVLLCFFVMGFVDLVGIASNYVKADLHLTDAQANFIPSLLFVWFLVFSVPTGMLMNKIGRKKTVMISLLLTCLSMVLPVFGNSYALMLCSFSLLGISNAILQVALNPLLGSVVGDENMAANMTLGQFVKAIASFLAPIIASAAAAAMVPHLGWRVLFPIYLLVVVGAALWLGFTKVEEKPVEKPSTFLECLSLLGKPAILLAFLGILCHVGIDVGVNLTAPKLLIERIGITLDEAAIATSIYFLARTIGSFTGSFLLRKMSNKLFFIISVALMLTGFAIMYACADKTLLYIAFLLVGLGNSNVFSLVVANAFAFMPEKQNEISSLMIMALFGGTVFPSIMGFLSDKWGQGAAVLVMVVGGLYLLYYSLKKNEKAAA